MAGWLTRRGVRPNQISLASVGFAALAGLCLVLSRGEGPPAGAALLLAGAAFIQLRLLCNLFDGMVAVEGGMATKSGGLFNDLPDRVSDPLILIAAGYSTSWPDWGGTLGWVAALLAVLTAYVRVLGASLGAPHDFGGPMAKQHRMAVMTAACLGGLVEALVAGSYSGLAMNAALSIVALGCIATIARRARRLAQALEAQGLATPDGVPKGVAPPLCPHRPIHSTEVIPDD